MKISRQLAILLGDTPTEEELVDKFIRKNLSNKVIQIFESNQWFSSGISKTPISNFIDLPEHWAKYRNQFNKTTVRIEHNYNRFNFDISMREHGIYLAETVNCKFLRDENNQKLLKQICKEVNDSVLESYYKDQIAKQTKENCIKKLYNQL